MVKIIEISDWDVAVESSKHIGTAMCQTFSEDVSTSIFSNRKVGKIAKHKFLIPLEVIICEDTPESGVQNASNNRVVFDHTTANDWISYIKNTFYTIDQVESIYVAINENNVDVWVFIPKRDYSLLRRLVSQEMRIIENFANMPRPNFLLEFHMIYRCGNDVGQFIPQRAIFIPR